MLPASQFSDTLTPNQVLLVEDEPIIRMMLAEELRAVGLKVVEASNADEAWSFLQAGGKPDLIVTDITMPGSMNGTELMTRVIQTYPYIKRIITSANPGPRNILELGRFLPKPYRLEAAAKMALDMLRLNQA
ncbi:MAG: response regulator [Rhodospirillales bacterium]|nr:response regulator [Rhodospirillales bacterium]MDE2319620.1 response regulator [Rhodospirillales bacterium]